MQPYKSCTQAILVVFAFNLIITLEQENLNNNLYPITMGTLKGGINFTGTVGDVTAYQVPGSSKTYLKRKSEISKERMQRDSKFVMTLQNAEEFKACGIAAGRVKRAMGSIAGYRSAGFNIVAKSISMLTTIKDMDPYGDRGQRGIRFSLFKQFLEGFSINDIHRFDSLVTAPLICDINRASGTATIKVPLLEAGLNLKSPWPSPMYRLSFALGTAEDVIFEGGQFSVDSNNKLPGRHVVITEWHYLQETRPASETTLQLQFPENLKENMALLVSAGIEMGVPITSQIIKEQKFQCAGKILKTG